MFGDDYNYDWSLSVGNGMCAERFSFCNFFFGLAENMTVSVQVTFLQTVDWYSRIVNEWWNLVCHYSALILPFNEGTSDRNFQFSSMQCKRPSRASVRKEWSDVAISMCTFIWRFSSRCKCSGLYEYMNFSLSNSA